MAFLKVDRRLFDHGIWHRKPFGEGQAWVDLLSLAAYKKHKVGLSRDVDRGQLWTTLRWLGDRWGWSKNKVARFLDELQAASMLIQNRDTKRDTGGTLISIVNYSKYQDLRENDEIEKDAKGTQMGHRKDTEGTQKGLSEERKKERRKDLSADADPPEDNGGPVKTNVWKLWIDVHRELGMKDPLNVKSNTGASRTLNQIPEADLRKFMIRFLNDKEPWLVNHGHPLRLLAGKIDAYQQTPRDPNAVKYIGFEADHEELFKDVPECYKRPQSTGS